MMRPDSCPPSCSCWPPPRPTPSRSPGRATGDRAHQRRWRTRPLRPVPDSPGGSISPRAGNLVRPGERWAGDNDAFGPGTRTGSSRCSPAWKTCRVVSSSPSRTWWGTPGPPSTDSTTGGRRWRGRGFPVALVGQDGAEGIDLDWRRPRCLVHRRHHRVEALGNLLRPGPEATGGGASGSTSGRVEHESPPADRPRLRVRFRGRIGMEQVPRPLHAPRPPLSESAPPTGRPALLIGGHAVLYRQRMLLLAPGRGFPLGRPGDIPPPRRLQFVVGEGRGPGNGDLPILRYGLRRHGRDARRTLHRPRAGRDNRRTLARRRAFPRTASLRRAQRAESRPCRSTRNWCDGCIRSGARWPSRPTGRPRSRPGSTGSP